MNESQLHHFRSLLERRREEIHHRIEEDQRRAQDPFAEGVRDVGDTSVQTLITDTDLTLGDRRTQQLYEIDAALRRIDNGTYGECAECGGEIELKRLEALPTATTCTECAAERETTAPPTL
jgi:DnaK suppressor protein